MPRTTVDIDMPVLKEIKSLHKKEHRTLGQIVSQLLSESLARRRAPRKALSFKWTSRSMRALVDLTDKGALYAILNENKRKTS
jgi:hypothetical protein